MERARLDVVHRVVRNKISPMALWTLDPKHVGRFGFKRSLGPSYGVHCTRLIGRLHSLWTIHLVNMSRLCCGESEKKAMCGETSVESSTTVQYCSTLLSFFLLT